MKSFTFAVLAATAAAQIPDRTIFDAAEANGSLISPGPNGAGAEGDKMTRARKLLLEFIDLVCDEVQSMDGNLDGEAASEFASASNAVASATNGEFGDSSASADDMMMMMTPEQACTQAQYFIEELRLYESLDAEGKKAKEEEWQNAIQEAVQNAWSDMMGATSTTTFAAALAGALALLSF